MKKQLTVLVILLSVFLTGNLFAQGVGINNLTPAPSAMLDVTSTSKGMLIPRMTSAQRLAIVAPANGLMVYETTTNQFFYFDGTIWKPFSSTTNGWNVTGNAGTTAATNFIGTTDAADVVVKTNNTEKMRITSNGIGIGTTAPQSQLHVEGNIQMVDGNQAAGKIMTSDANGKATWQDDKHIKYYTATGTTSVIAPPTSLVAMPQMSVTFTAKDTIAFVHFNAAGSSTGTCGQNSVSFQVLLNSVVVQTSQTSIEDINNFTANKIWDIAIEVPVRVNLNTTNTISILCGHLGTASCSNIANGPGSVALPNGSYRVLTVIDPNGGGGVSGSGVITSNFWAHTGNAGTNPLINFIGTSDAADFVVRTNNSEKIRVTSGGNVGIGTVAAPTAKLEVNGQIKINGGGIGAGKVLTSDATGLATWQTPIAGWSLSGNAGTNPAANFIGTTDVQDAIFKTNSSERMRILSGGNIGIGTSAPTAKLSVSRVGGIDDILTLSDDSNSLVIGTDFDLPDFIRIRTTNGSGIAITNNGDAIGLFVKSDASANVGIATVAPVSTLDINGSFANAIRSTSSSTTLTVADHTLIITNSVVAISGIALPSAASCKGREYIVVNQSITQHVTSISYASFTGALANSIPSNSSITLQSNGVSWIRVR